jgi:hypothetical protein
VANTFIKAQKVVFAAIGVLEREITLVNLVWKDPGGSFRGALGDTSTLRAGTPITIDTLNETKVNVTLDTDVYKAIGVTDEELTLDIVDFGLQVLNPSMHAVGRGVEDALVARMNSATYDLEVTFDPADPWKGLVAARIKLNKARVPAAQRFLAVGAGVEQALLTSDRISLVQNSGQIAAGALADATLGFLAGFQVVSHPALPDDIAIAAHKTAFAMSMQAPVIPSGASWGSSESYAGMALRALRDYDMPNTRDRLLIDTFVGTNIVRDHGTLDSDGDFVPSDDPDTDNGTDLVFARAVKLTL